MDHPLVSVIVPVYNTEAYLPRCLDSLLAQTCPDFEVILINNGSTDSCAEICRQYAERDNRFRVFAQENMGVSGARNTGISCAQGDYLLFADSDDYVAADFVACLLGTLQKEQADLVVCDYFQHVFTNPAESIDHFKLPAGTYEKKAYLATIGRCPGAHYVGVLWNKIYRADWIRQNEIRFPEGISLGEDFVFNMAYLQCCKKICCIPEQLYHYIWQRPDSLDMAEHRIDVAARCENRNVLYRAYRELYRHEKLDRSFRYRMIFYALKAYADDLEELGDNTSVQKILYYKYIRNNEISRAEFLVFLSLKKGMRLLKKGRGKT